ncbi:MAG: enoyl-CoA hydratase/isomerase family protein, partial [Thermodesulfobacteriota bacterium]|nr:enoyl-CoA hydratase/isomerase family protein [Thermodesulfobacteriota bacterium]
MPYKTIEVDISDAVATLTFNRPKVLNALNLEVIAECGQAISQLPKPPEAKVLVLTGAGRAFVAGADISVLQDLDPLGAKEFARKGQSLLLALEALDIP